MTPMAMLPKDPAPIAAIGDDGECPRRCALVAGDGRKECLRLNSRWVGLSA